MIEIPAASLKEASKLISRVLPKRATLPVLSHVLLTTAHNGVTLAATNLDQWLETFVPLPASTDGPESFLLPADALSAALKADKDGTVRFARKGPKGNRTVKVAVTCDGLAVQSTHPTLETGDFPPFTAVEGESVMLPARTAEVMCLVAPCASTDSSRHVLNGVFFTPEDGGMVIATDGKRLAGAPATVPGREFILPNEAVKILSHPDFRNCPLSVTLSDDPEKGLVCIRSGNHMLASRTIDGNYPNWRQVVPREMVASVAIAEDRRAAVVSWLRSKRDRNDSVILARGKRGTVVLSHATDSGAAATMEVPAAITGEPAPVALTPAFLADALEIAPVLWITDALTPVVARRADGIFGVVMPRRATAAVHAPAAVPGPVASAGDNEAEEPGQMPAQAAA